LREALFGKGKDRAGLGPVGGGKNLGRKSEGQKEWEQTISSDIHPTRRNNHPATVGDSVDHKKKLIEVALPLDAIR